MNDETRMTNDENPSVPGARLGEASLRAIRHSESVISLWTWVLAGFLLLVTAWGVMFTAARSVKIELVPLATRGARP